MRVGIFADSHDHLDNIRCAVEQFNAAECELVVFAGDLVSTFAVPPLRKLNCPVIGCFGDNEGNKLGLLAGLRIIGRWGEPPFGFKTADGTRFLLAHMYRQLREVGGEFDVAIYAHTHRPEIQRDELGRLFINPGETGGWTYRDPTIVLLETTTREAEIIRLNEFAESGACDDGRLYNALE